MRRLLGIDLGTSSLKAAVFALDGTLLGLGRAANSYLAGPAGWAEQDPGTWWTGCCKAVGAALAQAQAKPAGHSDTCDKPNSRGRCQPVHSGLISNNSSGAKKTHARDYLSYDATC